MYHYIIFIILQIIFYHSSHKTQILCFPNMKSTRNFDVRDTLYNKTYHHKIFKNVDITFKAVFHISSTFSCYHHFYHSWSCHIICQITRPFKCKTRKYIERIVNGIDVSSSQNNSYASWKYYYGIFQINLPWKKWISMEVPWLSTVIFRFRCWFKTLWY